MKKTRVYADSYYILVGVQAQATEGRSASSRLTDDFSDAVPQK